MSSDRAALRESNRRAAEAHERRVCAFARLIVSSERGEAFELVAKPDLASRNAPAVDELWQSATARFLVEHTIVESYAGQRKAEAKVEEMIVPVRAMLAGALSGRFEVAVFEDQVVEARIDHAAAQREIARLVLAQSPHMNEGDIQELHSDSLPFRALLKKTASNGSFLGVRRIRIGDEDEMRDDRLRMALSHKADSLAAADQAGDVSVSVFESNDSQLANHSIAYQAFRRIGNHDYIAQIVIYVETDAGELWGWIFKLGSFLGDDIPLRNSNRGFRESDMKG